MNGTCCEGGFTLVEMALVLLIVGLLLGAVATPLTQRHAAEAASEAERRLEEAEEALMGFAVIERRLPCPDQDGDGDEDPGCAGNASGGVPWRTLGLRREGRDPWGRPLRYAVSAAFTVAVPLTADGTLRVCEARDCARKLAVDVPALILSTGPNGEGAHADEAENRDGDATYVLRPWNADFDDRLRWLSANPLINRLVAAGVLP